MRFSLVVLIGLFSIASQAQVVEGTYELSLGDQPGFLMDHPDADKKIVEDVIEEYLKGYGKVKRNRKAKEWTCENCLISQIEQDPIDVYFKIQEGRGMVSSYIFFDDGYGFLEGSDAIEKFLMNIFHEVQREVIRKDIEGLEKDLSSFTKDLSKLVKKNKGLHEDIEEYRAKILQAEKDIEQNLHDQEDKKMQIEKQKRDIEKTTIKLNSVGRSKG